MATPTREADFVAIKSTSLCRLTFLLADYLGQEELITSVMLRARIGHEGNS